MDSRRKEGPKAYRFTMTAVSFGDCEDEALENLIDVLGRAALDALEDDIVFEALDYVYITREDFTPEA